MKKFALVLLAIGLSCTVSPVRADIVTITFDDLAGSSGVLTNQYGLTWTDSNWYSNGASEGYPPSSGTKVGYSNYNSNRINFGQEVTFLGAQFVGYNYGQYWVGYQNGVIKYTSAVQTMDGNAFNFLLDVNWTGVDAVSVFSNSDAAFHRGYDHYYVYDDLKYSTGGTASNLPDGGDTVLMIGSAFVTMLGFRRWRTK